jgi:hypothetical protein
MNGWAMTKNHIAKLKRIPPSMKRCFRKEELTNKRFKQYVYWFWGELIFKDHHICLDNHKDYMLNDIVKLKSMSVIIYLSRVNYMYEIFPYLQAPSNEGDTARKADYNLLQSEIDARVLPSRAQYKGLPKIFIHRAFHAALTPEEVCQHLKVLDPVLEDTYLARCMPMYYDTQGNTNLQSSFPMAYDELNADYSQYEDGKEDRKPSADGHYW